jgi:hypothetical protein
MLMNRKFAVKSPDIHKRENKSPDIKRSPKFGRKDDKKLSELLKIMNKNVGANINFDMKKLGRSDKSPTASPKNLKKNDLVDYLNAHKMFVELNVR